MPFNKTGPGTVIVSNKFMAYDVLKKNAYSDVYGVTQPENSVLERVFVRVLEAPVFAVASNIALEAGTTFSDPSEIINDGGVLNNVLSSALTLAKDTVLELTDQLETGVVTDFQSDDREIYFRFKAGNQNVTTAGAFEVSFVYRVFD